MVVGYYCLIDGQQITASGSSVFSILNVERCSEITKSLIAAFKETFVSVFS